MTYIAELDHSNTSPTHNKFFDDNGYLILKGYGKILRMVIDNDKPLLIEDASLIAMEERIDFNTVDVKISDELKEFLKSGVEAPYSIKGNGVIWLQTKGEYALQE